MVGPKKVGRSTPISKASALYSDRVRIFLLQCMSPLLGVKRTSVAPSPMSAFDPKRKSGAPFCCAVLCCAVLCCAVLCCAVLHNTAQCCDRVLSSGRTGGLSEAASHRKP